MPGPMHGAEVAPLSKDTHLACSSNTHTNSWSYLVTHASPLFPLKGLCERSGVLRVISDTYYWCYVKVTTFRKIGIKHAACSQVNVAIEFEYNLVFSNA